MKDSRPTVSETQKGKYTEPMMIKEPKDNPSYSTPPNRGPTINPNVLAE